MHLTFKLGVLGVLLTTLAGCGSRTFVGPETQSNRTALSEAARPAPATARTATKSILEHPFVLWVKKQHPDTAVAIINDYIGIEPVEGDSTAVETERDDLRRQVVSTVQTEFTRSLDTHLPDDLRATSLGDRIQVAGRVKYQIHDIQLKFDMAVRLDAEGKIWVSLDERSVQAAAMNPLVGLFGGNLTPRALKAVEEAFDREGSRQVGRVAGLHYVPGGQFYIDCGEAFVHMKSLPSETRQD